MRPHLRSVPTPLPRPELVAQARAALSEVADALARIGEALDELAAAGEPSPGLEPPPRLLTVPQAAKALSLGASTVHELVRSGRLGSVKIGAARRVPVEAIDAFVGRTKAAS